MHHVDPSSRGWRGLDDYCHWRGNVHPPVIIQAQGRVEIIALLLGGRDEGGKGVSEGSVRGELLLLLMLVGVSRERGKNWLKLRDGSRGVLRVVVEGSKIWHRGALLDPPECVCLRIQSTSAATTKR